MRLVSPVFGKEMVTLARLKSQFIVRGLMLGALLSVMAMSWSSTAAIYQGGIIDTSYIGRQLFMFFAITQLVAVVILVPVLTAPVIAGEKDKNTLGLLLMSNLSLNNLLLDKLLSRFILMILLLASGLPLFIALLAFGGITPGQIFATYISIFATILFCGGLGLLASTITNKAHTAMIAAYALIIGYYLFLIYMFNNNHIPDDCAALFFPICIFGGGRSNYDTFSFLAWSGIMFIACLVASKKLLPRMAGQVKRHAIKRLSERMNTFFERINFTGVEVFKDAKTVSGNAIFWKEARKSFFSSNTFIIRACYVLLALSMYIMATTSSPQTTFSIMTVSGILLLVLIALVSSSTAFAGEREKHSLDLLLSTPLTARALVLAKFAGVLKLLVPVILCLGIWFALAYFLGSDFYYDRNGNVLQYIIRILIADLPMLIVIGLYSSARRRRTGAAIAQSFLILSAWNALPATCALFYGHNATMFNLVGSWYSFDYNFILSMAPLSSLFLISDNSFMPLAALFLVPIWIGLLIRLIKRFDAMVGRQ